MGVRGAHVGFYGQSHPAPRREGFAITIAGAHQKATIGIIIDR